MTDAVCRCGALTLAGRASASPAQAEIERLRVKVADAARLISGFVRRYDGMQDGNGNEPTELRRAKRFLAALQEPNQ